MLLVDRLRELGLSMGSVYNLGEVVDATSGDRRIVRNFISWTTDEEKATAAQRAGGRIVVYRSLVPGDDSRRFDGWEVIARSDQDADG